MSEAAVTPVTGQPLSWEQFLELPDDVRAEFVDGRVFVSAPPSFGHQDICQRLRDALVTQVGDQAVVAVAVGWLLPGERRRLRIPDLMLLAARPSDDVVTGVPPVVVEVLSTNRGGDLVRKSMEYFDAGAGQYWIIDPCDRVVDVYQRGPGGWDHLAQLTDEAPSAVVAAPPFGEIELSLADILE